MQHSAADRMHVGGHILSELVKKKLQNYRIPMQPHDENVVAEFLLANYSSFYRLAFHVGGFDGLRTICSLL